MAYDQTSQIDREMPEPTKKIKIWWDVSNTLTNYIEKKRNMVKKIKKRNKTKKWSEKKERNCLRKTLSLIRMAKNIKHNKVVRRIDRMHAHTRKNHK